MSSVIVAVHVKGVKAEGTSRISDRVSIPFSSNAAFSLFDVHEAGISEIRKTLGFPGFSRCAAMKPDVLSTANRRAFRDGLWMGFENQGVNPAALTLLVSQD